MKGFLHKALKSPRVMVELGGKEDHEPKAKDFTTERHRQGSAWNCE